MNKDLAREILDSYDFYDSDDDPAYCGSLCERGLLNNHTLFIRYKYKLNRDHPSKIKTLLESKIYQASIQDQKSEKAMRSYD